MFSLYSAGVVRVYKFLNLLLEHKSCYYLIQWFTNGESNVGVQLSYGWTRGLSRL